MKKLSPYGRKLARCRQAAAQTDAAKELAELIRRDVRGLQIDAGIHTWTGNNAAVMTNLSGRLLYIVAFAASAAGYTEDHPDLRILRGMAEALGDLAANLHDIERHRQSIQSGLGAIDRLLPHCSALDLLEGSYQLDATLHATQGMGTDDVRALMREAA